LGGIQKERTVGSAKASTKERRGKSRIILATASRQGVVGMQGVGTSGLKGVLWVSAENRNTYGIPIRSKRIRGKPQGVAIECINLIGLLVRY